MAKEKAKALFEEKYFWMIVEGLITPPFLYYFMSSSSTFFSLGIFYILGEIFVIIYSIYLGDFRLLIIFLITEYFSGGFNNGK